MLQAIFVNETFASGYVCADSDYFQREKMKTRSIAGFLKNMQHVSFPLTGCSLYGMAICKGPVVYS